MNPIYKLIKGDEKLFVTGASKIWHSDNWGKKPNLYSEVRTPKLNLTIFCKQNISAKIALLSKEGKVMNEQDLDLKSGFEQHETPIFINEKHLKTFEKDYFEKSKPAKSDDGKYYPIIGEYKIRITAGDLNKEYDLEIE
jgi:hypothetical protein